MSKKEQYLYGLKAGLPVVVGFVSVAIAYAITAIHSGLASWQAVLMSAMVFAGASQMMAVSMLTQGAGFAAIVFATFVLNFRHLIMSTCVMNRLKGIPKLPKLFAAFGITDESFAIFTTEKEDKCSIYYLFGLLTVTYASWVLGTAIGCAVMEFLPPIIMNSMNITMYAMFIGLLVPNLRGNIKLCAVVLITAALSFLFSRFFSSTWAMICSTLIGAAVGVIIFKGEKSAERSKSLETECVE